METRAIIGRCRLLGALTLVIVLFVLIKLVTERRPWKTFVVRVRSICLVLQLLTTFGMLEPGVVVFLWTTWFSPRLCPALIIMLILRFVVKLGLRVTASGVTLWAAFRPPPVTTVLIRMVGSVRGR